RSTAWPRDRAAPDPFPPRPGRPPPVRSRRHPGRCRMVFAPCHEECTMATRDILKTLRAEHDELRQLFEQMEGTTDRAAKKRADLLARIKANLLPHAKWAETVFYPMFAERADRDGLKTHAEEGDDAMASMARKLVSAEVPGALDVGVEEWKAAPAAAALTAEAEAKTGRTAAARRVTRRAQYPGAIRPTTAPAVAVDQVTRAFL